MSPEHREQLALALCELFSGWHLLHDAPVLTRLGSGELTVDVLAGTCRHNLRWIAPLKIVGLLRSRVRQALAPKTASPPAIQKAELGVRLQFSEQSGLRNPRTVWVGSGDAFVACRLAMHCEVVTAKGSSAVSLDAWQEWPRELVNR